MLLFVACLTSQQHAAVYPRDGSAQTIVCTATLRQKLQTKLSISLSQPVPALIIIIIIIIIIIMSVFLERLSM